MNPPISKTVGVLVLLAAAATPLHARQWPDDPLAVSAAFGSASGGSFARGVGFRGENGRIRPWSAGEIIWMSDPSPSGDAVPGSGMVVLEHSDGFRSAYSGVEGRPDLSTDIGRDDWIGYASGDEWEFSILDTERNRIVDPLTLLPAREGLSPPLRSVPVLHRSSEDLELSDGMTVSAGVWSLSLDSVSAVEGEAIPAELSLYWVGERVGSLRFDSLREQDGAILLEVPDARSYGEVYDSLGRLTFRNIRLNTGRGILELRLRDETGRVVSRSWNLTVGE